MYDYVKSKYGEKSKLCFTNAGSFILYIKTEVIYSDIAKDVETRFYTLNNALNRSLSIGENKKV